MRELTLEAKIDNIPAVTEFVEQILSEMGCPMKAQIQIDVAVDELFTNISQYAYKPGTGSATVRVEKEADPAAAVITFIDQGRPYDPLKHEDPDITLSAEERPVGGLGIFMVKKTMDEVSYKYENGQNMLTVKKII